MQVVIYKREAALYCTVRAGEIYIYESLQHQKQPKTAWDFELCLQPPFQWRGKIDVFA